MSLFSSSSLSLSLFLCLNLQPGVVQITGDFETTIFLKVLFLHASSTAVGEAIAKMGLQTL